MPYLEKPSKTKIRCPCSILIHRPLLVFLFCYLSKLLQALGFFPSPVFYFWEKLGWENIRRAEMGCISTHNTIVTEPAEVSPEAYGVTGKNAKGVTRGCTEADKVHEDPYSQVNYRLLFFKIAWGPVCL